MTVTWPFDPYDKSDKEKAEAIYEGLKWMDKLDQITDVVLSHKANPKSKAGKKRKRKEKKNAKP